MKLIRSLILLVVLFIFPVFGEDKHSFSSVFTEIIPTSKQTLSTSFSKEALPGWGLILGSTAVLYQYDEQLYSYGQKKGRDWGIGNEDNTKTFISTNNYELLRLPTDTGSALYFLGDGWTHFGIAGGFLGYGQFSENTKAFNTGVILLHGITVSTIFNQTLKRSFGRESPNVKTSERGAWNLFPSFNEYNSRTGSYDAMPSGHVMTATLTFTIISERYPKYNSIIYPVAGIWITALGFQMLNNGVHWASDYPLGIAMGYVIGKASTKIVQAPKENKEMETSWMFIPTVSGQVTKLQAVKSF